MLLRNKKAIELGVNFIVVLIISLVVFGLGIGLAFKFFGKATKVTASIDQQTKDELIRILASGEKVSIAFNKETVRVGNYHSFGLGIKNVGSPGDFWVIASLKKYVDEYDKEYTETGIKSDPALSKAISINPPAPKKYALKSNDLVVVPIVTSVSRTAKAGTYIINVEVRKTGYNGPLYGTIQKIYVTVP